ncbi:MAG: hypothetical protein R3E95_20375 [Thiolinea sp.]
MRHTPLQCGLDKYVHLDRDLDSLSLPAFAQQAEGVSGMAGRSDRAGLPLQPQSLSLCLHDQVVGIKGNCLSGKYDAWLGFAMVDSATPGANHRHGGPADRAHRTEIDFAAICTELPFDFARHPLPLRA